MGANISGIGSNMLVVAGVDYLGGTEHRMLPDMIEVGSFIGLAAMTQSDITIKNKDARILKSPTGQTVLLYSFYNNNMLILTDNEETLRALLTKLDSEKLSR